MINEIFRCCEASVIFEFSSFITWLFFYFCLQRRIFTCEICDKEFHEKFECLAHKKEHFAKRSNAKEFTSRAAEAKIVESMVSELRPIGKKKPTGNSLASGLSPEDVQYVDLEIKKKLAEFTDEQIWQGLQEKGDVFVCVCKMVFTDASHYQLHSACHDPSNPLKCNMCPFLAKDVNDFSSHFFVHKDV